MSNKQNKLVNNPYSMSTRVSWHQLSRKYTSPTVHTFIISMRLFISYQFPPFLWSSASDAQGQIQTVKH